MRNLSWIKCNVIFTILTDLKVRCVNYNIYKMRLSVLLLFLAIVHFHLFSATSPHGKNFKLDCATCHTPSNWQFKEKDNTFNHSKTGFPLDGQHKMLKCKECHTSLVFSQATKTCVSCHKDIHQGTVGFDCNRCHNTRSWIVPNIRQVHQRRGFALVGQHASQDCNMCHPGSNQLRFENRRSDCAACHMRQFNSALIKVPSLMTGTIAIVQHKDLPDNGNLYDCYRCHNMVGKSWSYRGRGFEHGFFPLKGGHSHLECNQCHTDGFNPPDGNTGLPSKLNRECSSCHSVNKGAQKVPAHRNSFAKFVCSQCHNVSGWSNVKMSVHDGWFKISSGHHKGVGCLECHNNDTEFKPNCRRCHNWDYTK